MPIEDRWPKLNKGKLKLNHSQLNTEMVSGHRFILKGSMIDVVLKTKKERKPLANMALYKKNVPIFLKPLPYRRWGNCENDYQDRGFWSGLKVKLGKYLKSCSPMLLKATPPVFEV